MSLKTPTKESHGLYKEKGSSFISICFPISSEDDLKNKIKSLKTEHKNARHFCYAFRLGKSTISERCSDDGEPSGTAGLPILNTLKSFEISQAACVVIRYFGGTKLGSSGLINAYKLSTQDCVKNNVLGLLELRHFYLVKFEYSTTPMINSLIREYDLRIESKKFEEACEYILSSSENFNALISKSLQSFPKSQVSYMGSQ